MILLQLPQGHDSGPGAGSDHEEDAAVAAVIAPVVNLGSGGEMAQHMKKGFALGMLGMQVYFCDPHSLREKGTNVNTNGLLRQYFPKGSNLGSSLFQVGKVGKRFCFRPTGVFR